MDSVDYYNKYSNAYFDSTVEIDMSEKLNRFLEMLDSGDTVLDLGCGSGRDAKAFLDMGMTLSAPLDSPYYF